MPAPEAVPVNVSVPAEESVSVRPDAIESVSPDATSSVPEIVRSEVASVIVPAEVGSIVKFGKVFPAPTKSAVVEVILSVTPVKVIEETKVTLPDEVALPEIVGVVAPVKLREPN